jgi:hypothetical protein
VLNAIIKRRVAALALGAIALVVGIIMLSSSDVKCGNKAMVESDICVVDGNQNSYDEMKSADQQKGYLAIGFGALALLVGGVGFVLGSPQGSTRP